VQLPDNDEDGDDSMMIINKKVNLLKVEPRFDKRKFYEFEVHVDP
jgi:hypothetical protein